MSVELGEEKVNEDDIINVIRNASPNITIDSVTNRGTASPVIELTAVGDTQQSRDMSVQQLLNVLRERHPNIVIERISDGRVLSEEENKRNSYGIR